DALPISPRRDRRQWLLASGGPLNSSGGPSAARARCARAALLRCPRTPSAGVSALALSVQLTREPVQCSGASRPARFRCPRTPSAGVSALALSLPRDRMVSPGLGHAYLWLSM